MNFVKVRNTLIKSIDSGDYVRWALLVGITVVFIFLTYPHLVVSEHYYRLGDVAERDIKAPKDFLIEDDEATQANRRRAVSSVLTVYDHDTGLAAKIGAQVIKAFDIVRAEIEDASQENATDLSTDGQAEASEPVTGEKTLNERIWQLKADFEKELGISVSDGAYRILVGQQFSKRLAGSIKKILNTILATGVVPNKEILLRESDQGIVLRAVISKTEIIKNDLKQYLDLDQAKNRARTLGGTQLGELGYNLRNLIVDFVQELLQPNITLNRNETEERKKVAVAEIKPVLYKIKAGEMIVREGERVSEFQLLKLITLQAQAEKEQVVAVGLGAALVLLVLLVVVYLLCIQTEPSFRARPNKNLLLMACTLVAFFLLAQVSLSLVDLLNRNALQGLPPSALSYGIPLASGAMIICLFFGIELAIAFAIVIAACSAIIFHNRFEIFVYFFLNSAMAAYWIRDCRERRVFITCGAKVGCLNVILATALNLYLADFSGVKLLWDGSFAFLGGFAAGIVTAGIVPLVEIAFDYPTDIKLLELANLDRPILRRLMIEAPGTYHHSVVVGSLVEAAASDIGANPLLARVCGYYHDIGKINKPMYFIENQSNGKNKHDKLAPSMSSLILINHIKNGVDIARENKLGQTITDTIRQHHGTSMIKFFYKKAVQLRGQDAVDIAAFRYPGPRPQSRETGLVMLADVVEAASRTLENPTPSRIRGLVQNLINEIFSDGQLDNCDLTLRDLHSIAKSFNTILNGIHHHRIEYPEKVAAANGKGRNGSTDQQSSRQPQAASGKSAAKSTGHLKRLGQQ